MAEFDPNKPFEVVAPPTNVYDAFLNSGKQDAPAEFDPSKPFDVIPAAPTPLPEGVVLTGSEGKTFLQGAGGVVAEAAKGMIPKSAADVGNLIAYGASPLQTAKDQVGQTVGQISELFQGKPFSEVFGGVKTYDHFTPQDWGELAGKIGIEGIQGLAVAGGLKFRPKLKVASEITPAAEMPGASGFTTQPSGAPINLPETPEIAPTFQGLSPEADIPYMPPAKPYEYVPPEDVKYAGGSTSMFPLNKGEPPVVPQGTEPFNLGGVMTDAELAAEQAAIEKANAALAEEAARKARVQHGWEQKLTGDSGDVTQTEIGATKPEETLFNRDLSKELSPEEQRQAQREYEAELIADTEEHLTRGGDEFLDWLKREGLPTKGSKFDSPELNNLREMFESTKTRGQSGKGKGKARYGKGQAINNSGEKINYKDIFHNAEEHLDSLAQRAKRSGFPVETIDDFLNLVQDRLFNGKKFFGDEFMGEELERQSFRGRIERGGIEGAVPKRPLKGAAARNKILPADAVWGKIGDRYRPIYQINKIAGDKTHALAAARGVGHLEAYVRTKMVKGNLTDAEWSDMFRYLTSERLKEVYAKHIREGEIAPWVKHDLQLDPLEEARISRNPKIARAIHRYGRLIAPVVEKLRLQAGLKLEAVLGKNRSKFVSLYAPEGTEAMDVVHTPSGSVPLQFKSKTTAAAYEAKGFAKDYITDGTEIIRRSLTEVYPKVRLRELYEHLQKVGLVSSTPVNMLRQHPVVPFNLGEATAGELSQALPPKVWLPGPIADAIRDIMETPPKVNDSFSAWWDAAQNKTTGFALTANPAELFNHMHRQLAIVSAMPQAHVSTGVRLAEGLIPFFGPRLGVAIRTITRDASTPEFQAILKDIQNANAGSSRSFKEFTTEGIPGISRLQHATQKLLFGVPEGRGVRGWDLRMRVTLEEIRRAVEGNKDPQRMREFANQLGQYTDKPDKWIQTLRKVNPYVATTGPMRLTELRQLVGNSGLKAGTRGQAAALQAETILRGAGGTLIALVVANKLLSGNWPWENDPGHKLDLKTGMFHEDGRPIYWGLSSLAPNVARPLRMLGINSLDREWNAPEASKENSPLAAAMLGPVNEALSMANSPLVGAALGVGSGKALNLVKTTNEAPQFLDIVGKNGLTGDRGLDQIIAGISQINPLPKTIIELLSADEKKALPFPLNALEWAIPGKQFTSSYEKPSTGGGIAQPTRSRGRTRSRSRR